MGQNKVINISGKNKSKCNEKGAVQIGSFCPI